jgi:hypothetical protein
VVVRGVKRVVKRRGGWVGTVGRGMQKGEREGGGGKRSDERWEVQEEVQRLECSKRAEKRMTRTQGEEISSTFNCVCVGG